jgi:hypothetical protein
MSGIAEVYSRLRIETAKLLVFDIDALTPSQEVKLGMVAGLRLELDRLQTAQLRCEAIDPKQLVSISEMLEAALRPAEVRDLDGEYRGAREKLAALIERHAEEAEYEERRQIAELTAEVERLRAENERLRAVRAPAGPNGSAASLAEKSFNAPVVPLRPPRHRSEGWTDQREEWRGYVSEVGISTPLSVRARSWNPP